MSVGVGVSVGNGVDVSVGRGVSVGGMGVALGVGILPFEDKTGSGVEWGTQAVNPRIMVKRIMCKRIL